jgi:hypothetical protein
LDFSALDFSVMTDLESELNSKIQITKMDALRRQLRIAIRLWFADEDPVAIHTLIAAAHEILHRLYRDRGLSGLLFDSAQIKDEFRGEWARRIKSHANFFKHAAQKDESVIEFSPLINELFLLFCVRALADMREPMGPEEEAFGHWIFFHRPELISGHAYDNIPAEMIEDARTIRKSEFITHLIPLLERYGTVGH